MRGQASRFRRWFPAVPTLLVLAGLGRGASADEAQGHLEFFRQNRDFLLRAFERLPEPGSTAPTQRHWDFDPFATWDVREQLRAARAAHDTAATPEDLQEFHLALGRLLEEAQAAAVRLDDLDRRFAAHLRTAVEVTLATEKKVQVERLEASLDGEPAVACTLSAAERGALEAGGIVEVLRRVVEVRPQNLEVRWWVRGDPQPRQATHLLTPVPDALVRVHLDVPAAARPVTPVQSTLGPVPSAPVQSPLGGG